MNPFRALATETPDSMDLAPLLGDSTAGITSLALLTASDMRVVLLRFAAGEELTTHTNARRIAIHIVQGSCEVFFSNGWHRVGTDGFLSLPPNEPHALRASHGAFAMLLFLGPGRDQNKTPS